MGGIGRISACQVIYCNYAVTAPLRRFGEESSTRRLSYLDVQGSVGDRYYSESVHVPVLTAPDVSPYHVIEA